MTYENEPLDFLFSFSSLSFFSFLKHIEREITFLLLKISHLIKFTSKAKEKINCPDSIFLATDANIFVIFSLSNGKTHLLSIYKIKKKKKREKRSAIKF